MLRHDPLIPYNALVLPAAAFFRKVISIFEIDLCMCVCVFVPCFPDKSHPGLGLFSS